MMRPDAKVEKVYLYPKPVEFRKSIDGLAVLAELDINVAMFDPVLFVFLKKPPHLKCSRPTLRYCTPPSAETSLQLKIASVANTARYERKRSGNTPSELQH
ncbi:hypothetical protein PS893_00434 [Pseudomonas fluorescens]|nr:hypothetical protein PS893_00434 [Pseudomonas fluorescens]